MVQSHICIGSLRVQVPQDFLQATKKPAHLKLSPYARRGLPTQRHAVTCGTHVQNGKQIPFQTGKHCRNPTLPQTWAEQFLKKGRPRLAGSRQGMSWNDLYTPSPMVSFKGILFRLSPNTQKVIPYLLWMDEILHHIGNNCWYL